MDTLCGFNGNFVYLIGKNIGSIYVVKSEYRTFGYLRVFKSLRFTHQSTEVTLNKVRIGNRGDKQIEFNAEGKK